MDKYKEPFGRIIEYILPWFVLAILLLYTYARFFEYPYQGFRLDSAGRVIELYVYNPLEQSLQLGDRLIRSGILRWDDFRVDLRRPYSDIQPGQVVLLTIERDQHLMDVSWTFPNPTEDEIVNLAFNEGWLAYVFWFVGSLTLFNIRPKDERWRLMIASNYLTAMWLITGSGLSFYHIWESAIVLHMTVWLCVPVYLHLHWVFPKPLSKRPWQVVWGGI